MSETLTNLEKEHSGLIEIYSGMRSKYADKPVSEWETSDRGKAVELRGKIEDVETVIYLEKEMARAKGLVEDATQDHQDDSGRDHGNDKQMRAFSQAIRNMGRGESWMPELRGQSADLLGEGGYLVAPQQIISGILKKVDDTIIIPTLSTVFNNVGPKGLGQITEKDSIDEPSWGTEKSEAPETDAEFGERSLMPIEQKLLVKVTEKLLENDQIDIAAYLQGRIAYKYGISAEKAYMGGTGVNQPLGIFTESVHGISASRDVISAASLKISADDILDITANLKEGHSRSAVFILHRQILKEIRKLKGADGHYIWQPDGQVGRGLVVGNPATINGYPYYLSEYAPGAVEADKYALLFGNFEHYYIARGGGLRIKTLQELYAAKFQIGYRCLDSMDAMPVLEEAFTRLKIKA